MVEHKPIKSDERAQLELDQGSIGLSKVGCMPG
jgi:hypothetical protein